MGREWGWNRERRVTNVKHITHSSLTWAWYMTTVRIATSNILVGLFYFLYFVWVCVIVDNKISVGMTIGFIRYDAQYCSVEQSLQLHPYIRINDEENILWFWWKVGTLFVAAVYKMRIVWPWITYHSSFYGLFLVPKKPKRGVWRS